MGLGQMIEALDRGVSTFTTTAINLPYVEVHRLYRAGDRDAARRLFDETAPMLIWCQTHLDVSIHFLKRYCVAAGLFSTDRVRQPGFEFDDVHRRIADELIGSTLMLEERLRTEQDRHLADAISNGNLRSGERVEQLNMEGFGVRASLKGMGLPARRSRAARSSAYAIATASSRTATRTSRASSNTSGVASSSPVGSHSSSR